MIRIFFWAWNIIRSDETKTDVRPTRIRLSEQFRPQATNLFSNFLFAPHSYKTYYYYYFQRILLCIGIYSYINSDHRAYSHRWTDMATREEINLFVNLVETNTFQQTETKKSKWIYYFGPGLCMLDSWPVLFL